MFPFYQYFQHSVINTSPLYLKIKNTGQENFGGKPVFFWGKNVVSLTRSKQGQEVSRDPRLGNIWVNHEIGVLSYLSPVLLI